MPRRDQLHIAVFDPVVDHLDVVARSARPMYVTHGPDRSRPPLRPAPRSFNDLPAARAACAGRPASSTAVARPSPHRPTRPCPDSECRRPDDAARRSVTVKCRCRHRPAGRPAQQGRSLAIVRRRAHQLTIMMMRRGRSSAATNSSGEVHQTRALRPRGGAPA